LVKGDLNSLCILPRFLPDGRGVLFTSVRGLIASDAIRQIEMVSLDGKTRRVLVKDAVDGRYVSSGHLVFVRDGRLMAVRLDLKRGEVVGNPVVVLDDVMQALNGGNTGVRTGAAQYAVSPTGDLAYLTGGLTPDRKAHLTWLDRRGVETPVAGVSDGAYLGVRLSPNGKHLALTTSGRSPVLQILDLERASLQTFPVAVGALWPLWTPDGQRVLYTGVSGDSISIFVTPIDGSRPPKGLGEKLIVGYPAFWEPNGKDLVVLRPRGEGLVSVSPADGKAREIANLPENVRYPVLSPDGKLLAYSETVGNLSEVYVQPWPALDRKWKISTGFAGSQVWTKGGRELVYIGRRETDSLGVSKYHMMAVDVTMTAGEPIFGRPHELFTASLVATSPLNSWDATADGSRFIAYRRLPTSGSPPGQIHLIMNWVSGLQ
jgi:hypothetical protein